MNMMKVGWQTEITDNMKIFYVTILTGISFIISAIIFGYSKVVEADLYWVNSIVLLSIIGIATYYRYEEYEKNKNK